MTVKDKIEQRVYPLNLETIFNTQSNLQALMDWPGGIGQAGTKEMLLGAMVECTEALDEINWKPWKAHIPKDYDKEKFTTELTDIIQFVINAALCMNLTAEDLTIALQVKWVENYARIKEGKVTSV